MKPHHNSAVLADEIAPLIRYLRPRVASDEDASDLAQEAFLRMHKFQQSRKLDNARAFLFKIAANLAVDQLRRERVHVRYLNSEMVPQRSDEEPERCEPSAERTVSAVQELDIINTVVAEMPPKVRRAFLLHRGKDLSYPQIAQEMNVSTSMVEKYIVQALRILRERVSQTGD